MANFLYDLAREAFLDGNLSWGTDDIRAVLVDTDTYTANQATDDFLDVIGAGNRVAVSGAFTGKSVTAGVADAADITFTTVSGDVSEALVIYHHTGTDGTSELIAYIDTASGLPVTPGGGDVNITWDDGANKIFKL